MHHLKLQVSYPYLGSLHHQTFRSSVVPPPGDRIVLLHTVPDQEARLSFLVGSHPKDWIFSQVLGDDLPIEVLMELNEPMEIRPE